MSTHSHSDHDHPHGEHGHAHGHSHAGHGGGRRSSLERAKDKRRLIWAVGLTGTIAVAEAVGGFLTGSLALLSDAGHMLTDVSALLLSLVALWIADRPADPKKTYGYYRMEILSALANGVLLLAITGFIVVEAYQRLQQPVPVNLGPMMVVALIGLLANVAAMASLHQSHSMNVRGAFMHVVGDALSSVGVLVAGTVMYFTGWYQADALVSVLIAVVIVVGAYRLVRDAVDVLLEAVPAHVDTEAVRQLLAKVPGVTAVHDLHIWTISSGIYALSAHLVVVDPVCQNNDQILSAVKHDLLDRFGIDHTTIQIESETYAHLGEVH